MTITTARRKLHHEIRDAEKEQLAHRRRWGQCLPECEQVHRERWMREALALIGGRAP